MSAHPDVAVAEASDAPTNSGDRFEDFADYLEADKEEEDNSEGDEPEDDAEPEEGEAEDQPEEEEPEAPAIDPPVSWDADAKELFSQLPPELQAKVAQRESEREKFVQAKATEAAEARKKASTAIETQTALHQDYATHLETIANALVVPAPPANLAYQDQATYVAQLAQHQESMAQWQQLTAQAEQVRAQIAAQEQQATAAFYAAETERLATLIPEAADPVVRARVINEAHEFGISLGYAPDVVAKMDATDVLTLHQAAQWKAKADKYDSIQKGNMAKVRSAKTMPKVVKPGVAPTQGEIAANRSQAAWQNVKGARTSEDKARAFADYLGL